MTIGDEIWMVFEAKFEAAYAGCPLGTSMKIALEAVAPLIAAQEREACAEVAENNGEPNYADDDESLYSQGYDFAGTDIARAIRARGDD